MKATENDKLFSSCGEDGVRYNYDGTILISCEGTSKEIRIKNGTHIICDEAFKGNQYVEKIYIPSSVSNIGENAFSDCQNLKAFETESTDSSGKGFFSCDGVLFECGKKMRIVRFPPAKDLEMYKFEADSDRDKVEKAFEGCDKLKHIEYTYRYEDEQDFWDDDVYFSNIIIKNGNLDDANELDKCIYPELPENNSPNYAYNSVLDCSTDDLLRKANVIEQFNVHPYFLFAYRKENPCFGNLYVDLNYIEKTITEHMWPSVNDSIIGCLPEWLKNSKGFLKDEIVKSILQSIPIYFVTTPINTEKLLDGKIVPNNTVERSTLTKTDVEGITENIDPDMKTYKAMGMYVNEQNVTNYKDIPYSSSIFIWTDEIQRTASSNDLEANMLLMQVLLHELAHALMDIYKELKSGSGIEKLFHLYREESLANGVSLYLLEKLYSYDPYADSKIRKIRKFIYNQPLEYRLGLKYDDKKTLEKEIPLWMSQKSNNSMTNEDIVEWFKEQASLL